MRDRFPLCFGLVATALFSGTLLIAGLKAGISPGVSPLVILLAWGAFGRRLARRDGSRVLNLAQVAGSAGMAVTVGVIFTAPVVQILATDRGTAALEGEGLALPRAADGSVAVGRELLALLARHGHAVPPVDVPSLFVLALAGALIGFGFVGLGARRFLADPTLPAPEARACVTMIRTATSAPEARPRLATSLGAGFAASFAAPLAIQLGLAQKQVVLASTRSPGDPSRSFSLDLPLAPIYLGIGGLLTLSTALLVFLGAMIRLLGDRLLAGLAADGELALRFPGHSMRWVGGAAMTVAVVWSLVRFFGLQRGRTSADPLVELSPGARRLCRATTLAGALIAFLWLLARDGPSAFTFAMTGGLFACAAVMVVLGALLSLQIGSSASPVSGTIFVTTLVLCLVALAVGRRADGDVLLLTPLLVAACVAVCAANDSSQDYKTLQLCGLRIQDGFAAQLAGLFVGCLVVPAVLALAHEAYVLGSAELVAPQGKMFATLIDGLLLRDALPWAPIALGLGLGAAAVVAEVLGRRRGLQLSAMALAVGIYLPATLGTGILIGSCCRRLAEGRRGQSHASILTAAGLIAGAASFELLLGLAIVFLPGFQAADLGLFSGAALPRAAFSVLGIALLGAILYANSRRQRPG